MSASQNSFLLWKQREEKGRGPVACLPLALSVEKSSGLLELRKEEGGWGYDVVGYGVME